MTRRRSSIKGDFKLRRLLRNIHAQMDNELKPAMHDAANLVLDTQRRLIPKDTGAARNALQARVSKQGLDARIGILGKADNRRFYYLPFVERGTKGYSGKTYHRQDLSKPGGTHTNSRDKSAMRGRRNALRARATKNKSNGKAFFGYFPAVARRTAKPWLRPSIDINRDQIREMISKAIASTLQRAAKGVGNE